MTQAGRKLGELLAAGQTIVAPGVYDPLGGRLVQHLGFSAAYMGGWITGAHLATTEPLLTMTEQVTNAGRVARAIDLPLIVDGNAGFGEPLHTLRTVREFEDAGVAAIHLEDQQFPKRAHYHKGVEYVCDREDFLTKLRLALEARRSPDFKIIARTDAGKSANADWKEAVWRCNAALELGADAIMPLARSDEVLLKMRAALPKDVPTVVLSGYQTGQKDRTPEEYRELGFQIILYAVPSIIAAAGALRALYAPLLTTGTVPQEGWLGVEVSKFPEMRALVERLIGLPEFYAIEERTVEGERKAE